MKILVIGLNPSVKGGKSPTLKNLYKWLDYLSINIVSFTNLSFEYGPVFMKSDIPKLISMARKYDKVITLGTFVHGILAYEGVTHASLPHPSPRNRLLNDRLLVKTKLNECRNYIWGVRS